MERRKHKRFKKRIKVHFGVKDLSSSGFTGDVSAAGLFLVASPQVTIGQRLHLHFELEGQTLYQEGVVARISNVTPELRTVVKGGFGVRFLDSREFLRELVPSSGDPTARVLTFDTAWKLAEVFEKELKRGGVFLWSSAAVPLNTVFPIEFELSYLGQSIVLRAMVINVVTGPDGRFGLACMFVDGVPAASQFLPYLPKTSF